MFGPNLGRNRTRLGPNWSLVVEFGVRCPEITPRMPPRAFFWKLSRICLVLEVRSKGARGGSLYGGVISGPTPAPERLASGARAVRRSSAREAWEPRPSGNKKQKQLNGRIGAPSLGLGRIRMRWADIAERLRGLDRPDFGPACTQDATSRPQFRASQQSPVERKTSSMCLSHISVLLRMSRKQLACGNRFCVALASMWGGPRKYCKIRIHSKYAGRM